MYTDINMQLNFLKIENTFNKRFNRLIHFFDDINLLRISPAIKDFVLKFSSASPQQYSKRLNSLCAFTKTTKIFCFKRRLRKFSEWFYKNLNAPVTPFTLEHILQSSLNVPEEVLEKYREFYNLKVQGKIKYASFSSVCIYNLQTTILLHLCIEKLPQIIVSRFQSEKVFPLQKFNVTKYKEPYDYFYVDQGFLTFSQGYFDNSFCRIIPVLTQRGMLAHMSKTLCYKKIFKEQQKKFQEILKFQYEPIL